MAEASLPRILYKYYPPERLDVFENCSVRFTHPVKFNDAFDSNWAAIDKKHRADIFQFRNTLGIFCLTGDADNHLMWVHYAAQHTGFVIGFNTADSLFSDDGGKLQRVKYTAPPSGIRPPSIALCLYKDRDWSYEKEWRCIRPINSGQSRDIFLPPTALDEIVLGSKMSRDHITSVLEFVDLLKPDFNVTVSVSKLDIASKAISHAVSSLSLCPNCRGAGHIR
jgi:hypothetical protein